MPCNRECQHLMCCVGGAGPLPEIGELGGKPAAQTRGPMAAVENGVSAVAGSAVPPLEGTSYVLAWDGCICTEHIQTFCACHSLFPKQ